MRSVSMKLRIFFHRELLIERLDVTVVVSIHAARELTVAERRNTLLKIVNGDPFLEPVLIDESDHNSPDLYLA